MQHCGWLWWQAHEANAAEVSRPWLDASMDMAQILEEIPQLDYDAGGKYREKSIAVAECVLNADS